MRDLTGHTFGSYVLEELLGRGGMGEVYRARHVRLVNRRAAVKVLPTYLAVEPEFLQRFEREANNAASLDHPNILPVWDYGEQDGAPYLAMPLVEGGNLAELLQRQGPLAPRDAAPYLRQIGAALDYARSRGIIHRDVKPQNILLATDGRPLLADFGIAKAVEVGQQGEGLTHAGAGVGTPEYMAPEQIEGRASYSSDLYALGVVLYQLLTSQLPYGGATPYEIAYKQIHEPLPPIRQLAPHLPLAVEHVVQQALAKDAAARYSSGRAFADAFEQAIVTPDSAVSPVHDLATRQLGALPAAATARLPVDPSGQQAVPAAASGQQSPPSSPAAFPARRDTPRQPVAPLPPPTTAPPVSAPPQRASRWPLALATLLGLLLLLGLGGVYVYGAFGRAAPTPTAGPNLAGASTAEANFAAATTATAGVAVAQTAAASLDTTATAVVAQNAAVTATALQGAAVTATAGAASAATAAVQAGATTTAQADASATAAVESQTNATATANAGRAQTTQTAVAGGTATALARPTLTPTALPSPTLAPTALRPTPTIVTTAPASAWGPALAPLQGGKVYKDAKARFSFSVPQDWTEAAVGNAEVAFTGPRGAALMPPNMNVVLADTAGPPSITLDAYVQVSEAQLKRDYPDYKQISLDKVVINNVPAYRRIFTVTVSGVLVQAQQVYLLDKKTAHILTFLALPDTFAQQQRTFDSIAGSYQVGK